MSASDSPLLDHVAFAVESGNTPASLLEELGGRSVGGCGEAPGFRARQWVFRNGMKIELLQPFRVDKNDFLRRFLDVHGPGAHHLTFRVPDLLGAVGRLGTAGVPMHYIRTENPAWKEAFIHPKVAFGTVVQLAEFPDRPGSGARRATSPAAVVAVELGVLDLAGATRLYGDLLGGDHDQGACGQLGLRSGSVFLRWPGTGGIALVPTPSRELLGVPGRISRLILDQRPEIVPDHSSRLVECPEAIVDGRLGTPFSVLN
jgi:methylmalonyl-CoA/ethylmalonyl-CoA epimerase